MIKFDYRMLTGKVITKDDFEYEEERKAWNRAIEKYPVVIIYCYNEEDIKNTIDFAKINSLELRIRNGRHHYEGYSTGNDVVVIDVSKMKNIKIDEDKNTIKIQCGVSNREIYEVTGSLGYPFPGGGCPSVGVVGFTLGGGWGYSARLLGLGSDSLIEVELINSNGELVICNENNNTDLLWGLKGCGGGNFGVITSMTFKLAKKREMVTLINIDFNNIDFNENIKLVELWQELYKNLDNRANFKLAIYNSLERGKGVKIVGLFYGVREEANEILKPIKDAVSSGSYNISYIPLYEANKIIQDSHPEYEMYKSGGRFVYKDYNREEIINILKLIDIMAEGSTYTAITFYGLGGSIRDIGKKDTAFYYRDAKFILGFQSVWEEPKYAQKNRQWFAKRFEYIKSITNGSFINFPCNDIDKYEEEYYGENLNNLKKLKEKYDKDGYFNFEQCIPIEKRFFYNIILD